MHHQRRQRLQTNMPHMIGFHRGKASVAGEMRQTGSITNRHREASRLRIRGQAVSIARLEWTIDCLGRTVCFFLAVLSKSRLTKPDNPAFVSM